MPRGRRPGYNDDQQLSFEPLWAEVEPARDDTSTAAWRYVTRIRPTQPADTTAENDGGAA
jgi:hypothetical protein